MPKPYVEQEARAYSVAEVAKLMGCSRNYVYKLIHTGALRHIALGSVKVPHEFLLDFYREVEKRGLENMMQDKTPGKEGTR